MKKKIFFLSVSRSDFDRYSSIIKELNLINKSENYVLVSGSHYSKKFGYTYKSVLKSKFKYIKAIKESYILDDSNYSKNITNIANKLSSIFIKNRPDILVILGDRYEMLAGPIACLDKNIPIVHIHGGAVTYGAIDDNIRHALTKMSNIHYVSHKNYEKRLLQLGEEKWRIKNLGAPGLDNLKVLSKNNFEKIPLIEKNKIKKNQYILVCFNSETRALKSIKSDLAELFKFLKNKKNKNLKKILTYPNSDPGSKIIIDEINKYLKKNSDSYILNSFLGNEFYPILKNCNFLIGNSSVGIVEAASFKIPVINLGDRQKGKIHPWNVVSVKCRLNSILIALRKIRSQKYLNEIKKLKNPYGDGNSGKKIAKSILKIQINNSLFKKRFIDS